MKEPFGVHAFVDWLNKQDPSVEYDYCSSIECLFSMYLKSLGFQPRYEFVVGPDEFIVMNKRHPLPRSIYHILHGTAAMLIHGWPEAHTIGAAQERARLTLEELAQ